MIDTQPTSPRRISLSLRVSLGLVLAAILPLIIIVAFSEWQTRPALIAQANQTMENDAKTRVQLIDAYLSERLLDAQTLTQVPSVQEFLASPLKPGMPGYQDLATHASYALVAGSYRDKRYISWQLFDPQGSPRLFYPLDNPPTLSGKSYVSPEDEEKIERGKTFISVVYYSPSLGKAFVNIYSPIIATQQGETDQPPVRLGFIRAILNLDYIWNIVEEDRGNNGSGSYAFILDDIGIRIADTDPLRRISAVAPLEKRIQERINQEARYGSMTEAVPILHDAALYRRLAITSPLTQFQTQPTGQSEPFQVIQHRSTVVPWHFFVLSPLSTVTQVAYQQLFVTLLVASATSALVALLGLLAGRSITRPILRSVEHLRKSTHILSTLAERQRDASSEQVWVVDSSQVGLQSIQYYTEATRVAARQLGDVGKKLAQYWQQIDPYQAQQALTRIVAAARYIEEATSYQHASNEKLATALRVATQVTEQLSASSTSATEAAAQLEQVVMELRSVVGK